MAPPVMPPAITVVGREFGDCVFGREGEVLGGDTEEDDAGDAS